MQQAMAAACMVGTTVVAVGMIRMACSVVAAGQPIGCIARRLVSIMIVRGRYGCRVMRVQMPVMAAVCVCGHCLHVDVRDSMVMPWRVVHMAVATAGQAGGMLHRMQLTRQPQCRPDDDAQHQQHQHAGSERERRGGVGHSHGMGLERIPDEVASGDAPARLLAPDLRSPHPMRLSYGKDYSGFGHSVRVTQRQSDHSDRHIFRRDPIEA